MSGEKHSLEQFTAVLKNIDSGLGPAASQLWKEGVNTEALLRKLTKQDMHMAGINLGNRVLYTITSIPQMQVAGLQGNVLQKILETQQLLVEQTNTATYSLAYMLARSSAYELHKGPSSANSNPELKKSLISKYGLMDRKAADGVYLRCQAFGKEWGLINPDEDERNALVWFDGIEQAWNDFRFCLAYEQGVLRTQVLDETLLDISPVALAAKHNREHATERLRDMTFRGLDGRAIYFPAEVNERPYHRVVVTQAAHAITAMWKAGKLRKGVVPFRLDVLSEFDQKDACLAWVKTTMVHFPE